MFAVGKGLLVLGPTAALWTPVSGGGQRIESKFPRANAARCAAATKVDADGLRWLVGDTDGNLWLLACAGAAQGTVTSLKVNRRVPCRLFLNMFFVFSSAA